MHKLESKIQIDKRNWAWPEILDYEDIKECEEVDIYIREVENKQSDPSHYIKVALSTIRIKHITDTKRIVCNIIDAMKISELSKRDTVHYENDLLYLAGRIEDNYVSMKNKLNYNCVPTNEAIQALIYFKKKVLTSNVKMKELMQYNDKLKIDKFLEKDKLEFERSEWRSRRPSQPLNKPISSIDLNNNVITEDKRVVEVECELIIDENYTDL